MESVRFQTRIITLLQTEKCPQILSTNENDHLVPANLRDSSQVDNSLVSQEKTGR